jgi:hypothetical protein
MTQVSSFGFFTGNHGIAPENREIREVKGVFKSGFRLRSMGNGLFQTIKAFLVKENLQSHYSLELFFIVRVAVIFAGPNLKIEKCHHDQSDKNDN